MRYALILGIIFTSLTSGCASITGDSMQTVYLTTETPDGQTVAEANCSLSNEKGRWEATSPNMVSVHKASGDLLVECKKTDHADGVLRATSRANAGMYGNIIIGGGIGAIIDHSKGTAYNYPNDLPVVMGENVAVDRRNSSKKSKGPEDAEAVQTPQGAPSSEEAEQTQPVEVSMN